MTQTVTLPPDLAEKVRERIESGEGVDAIDVVCAGLEALDANDMAKLDAVRAKIAKSLADPRPSAPVDEVFDRIDALIRAYAKK